jgi:hemoglobin
VDRTADASLPDLDDAAQIDAMVRHFYRSVAQDDLLGPIFNDVARVDWPEHIDKLTAFWCRALLAIPGYEGNPLRAHALIHARHRFTPAHFTRWLELFDETLAEGWAGPHVDQARAFARRVATAHGRRLLEPAAASAG